MSDKNEQMQVCGQCKRSLPVMKDGKNNFCPSVDGKGNVINVCMECKTSEGKITESGGITACNPTKSRARGSRSIGW